MNAPLHLNQKRPRFSDAKVRVIAVLALMLGTALMVKISKAQNAAAASQDSILAKPAATPEGRAVQKALLRDMILNPRPYQVRPTTPAELASIQAMVDAFANSKKPLVYRTAAEAEAAASILNPRSPQAPRTAAEAEAIAAITDPGAYAKAKGITMGPPRFSFEQNPSEAAAAPPVRDPLVKPGRLDTSRLRPSVPRKP